MRVPASLVYLAARALGLVTRNSSNPYLRQGTCTSFLIPQNGESNLDQKAETGTKTKPMHYNKMYDIHELFHACEIGDIKRAEAFLEANTVGVDTQDSDDLTALQVAAANDQVMGKCEKSKINEHCISANTFIGVL